MTDEGERPAHGRRAAGVPLDRGKPVTALAASLSDGEWRHLHPASPLLKGGIVLIAVIGIVISNLRERFFENFMPGANFRGNDPIELLFREGVFGWALLALLGVLSVLVLGFYISWRMHTFRITEEVVEVRSGVLFRTNRKARLDRIQGINIVRPFFARLFGAARLEVNQAGQDANVRLDYLASTAADDLRREILRLASGTRAASVSRANGAGPAVGAGPSLGGAASIVEQRMHEFLAPELEPDAAEPESVVKLGTGRLIGSILLSGASIFLAVAVIVVIVASVFAPRSLIAFFGLVPAVLGVAGFYVQRFLKSLRYSIAGTPDGVRVGFGLLTTSNETLPPGRIHSVKVSQPLLWRGPGWWEIKVNRASQSSTDGAAGQQNTTILPVGNLADVTRVLTLVLPDLLDEGLAVVGLTGPGAPDDGFTNSPRRAGVLRWFSWRRNGFAVTPTAVLLRKGAIWRELVLVPHPRLQSVSVQQGPVLRMLRLAAVRLHTVAGPISAELGAIDEDAAVKMFMLTAEAAVRASGSDTSHRWRSAEGVEYRDGLDASLVDRAPGADAGGWVAPSAHSRDRPLP
ncbi:putative membrane protein [Marisediminicola sp. UYEF4]|uniref:PH domain-containing protein n=1 Tax=Marisediminicola sp. UYEF4 TaxID=1756384 RepID=UPI00339161EC